MRVCVPVKCEIAKLNLRILESFHYLTYALLSISIIVVSKFCDLFLLDIYFIEIQKICVFVPEQHWHYQDPAVCAGLVDQSQDESRHHTERYRGACAKWGLQ